MVTNGSHRKGGAGELDRLALAFDDDRAVAKVGLILASTLGDRLGIEQAIDETLDLGERPGAAPPGRKLLTLVHSALLAATRSPTPDVLRCGETERLLGQRVLAPSRRSWAAGAGPSSRTGCRSPATRLPGRRPRRCAIANG